MDYAKTLPNRDAALLWFVRMAITTAIGLIIGVAILFNTGCGTVAPKPVISNEWSWDGTNQNSGLICVTPDKKFVITEHAKNRYNSLVGIYGGKFVPPVEKGDGLQSTETNTWLIDAQHLEYFATMNRWHKSRKN